ncbi:HD domain-containing protein [Longimicrobium sp.]|uniref:HD domain-containing protein n=1 Tax=Longimicrobium sp. TaxID=2029185 RepID=UPI002E329C18|nr:HD domain-containing protein [Longimicrobium sp.]HEX6041720.1 HD domain-containing protein [Longimicrobium sp.]
MMDGMDPRLARQLAFIQELDRLKGILRQTRVLDGARQENSAEHSWHLAVCGVLLAEHAPPGTDLTRVLRMVLVHDVVEIDAGDAFAYDAAVNVGKEERELLAAERIFGLLPDEQADELRGLWMEFEAGTTPDARFAVALDRFQPLLLNFNGQGGSWRYHAVTHDRVLVRMAPIQEGAPTLWPAVLQLLDEAVARGYLAPAPPPAS